VKVSNAVADPAPHRTDKAASSNATPQRKHVSMTTYHGILFALMVG
jgi:hypothetical protein